MLKYGQMIITVEMVSPTIAIRWLEQNTGNRRLRAPRIEQYARDMAAENWIRKPVAICFDECGHLGNGQHTLHAIVKSGEAQELLVARGVPRKAIAIMDCGLARTLADVGKFIGENIESRRAAIARIMVWGPSNCTPRSFDEMFDAYQQHEDVIDLVCNAAPRKVGLNAAMLSVCAKAAYTTDTTKIIRFIDVICHGLIDGDHESAAIRLRDFVRSLRGSNATTRVETYNKTMSALRNFLDGKSMSKLYGTTEDLFPIIK